MEMVFNNKAVLKLLGIKSAKDLHALLAKRMFVHRENGSELSLLETIKSSKSDAILA